LFVLFLLYINLNVYQLAALWMTCYRSKDGFKDEDLDSSTW
jgi:hypothetical protein